MTVEICVKAATGAPHLLGDCPFAQKVLLTLEEKKIPYKMHFINLTAKPQWFLELNPEGKVPVIKFDDKWIAESDVIVGVIEDKFPNPPLSYPPEISSLGSKLLGSFMNFLRSKDPSDGTEQALLDELKALEEHLQNKVDPETCFANTGLGLGQPQRGPYVNGENICGVDLKIAPTLYQIDVALSHFKGWAIPETLTHVHHYKKLLLSLESFEKTKAAEEYVIAGWVLKLNA